MKKFITMSVIVIFLSIPVFSQTVPTPNVGLEIPAGGSTNWNLPLNFNFNLIDQLLGGTLQTPGLGLQLKSIFGNGAPIIACSANNQGQNYFDTGTSPWTQYSCNSGFWGLTGGGVISPLASGIIFGLTGSTTRSALPTDVNSLLSTLAGCSTTDFVYSPADGTCIAGGGGGGGSPGSPAFGLQFANSATTGFQADSNFLINPSTHTLTSGPNGLLVVNAFNSVPRAIYDPMDPNMDGGLAAAIAGTSGQTASQVIQYTLDYAKCQNLMGLATSWQNIPLPSGVTLNISQIKMWPFQELGGSDLITMPTFQHIDATKMMVTGHTNTDTLTCSDGHVYTPGAAGAVRIHHIGISGMGPVTNANDIGINSNGSAWLVDDIRGTGNGFGGEAILNNGFENVMFNLGYVAAQLKGCQSYITGTLPISSAPNGVNCATVEDDSTDSEIHQLYATNGAQIEFSGHHAGACYPNCAAFASGNDGDYSGIFTQVSDVDIIIGGSNSKFTNVRTDATSREMIQLTASSFANTLTNIQALGACTDTTLQANYTAGVATSCAAVADKGQANYLANFNYQAENGIFGTSFMQCQIWDYLIGDSASPNTYAPVNPLTSPGNATQNDWLTCGSNGDHSSLRMILPPGPSIKAFTTTINASGITGLSISTSSPITNIVGGYSGQQLTIGETFGTDGATLAVTGNIRTCSGLPIALSNSSFTILVAFGPPFSQVWAEPCMSPFSDFAHLNYKGNPTVANPSVLDLYGNERIRQMPNASFSSADVQLHGPVASSGQYCFEQESIFTDLSHVVSPLACTTVDLTHQTPGAVFVDQAPAAVTYNLWLVSNTTTSGIPTGLIGNHSPLGFGAPNWDGPTTVAAGGNSAASPPAGENTTGMLFDPWGVVINTFANTQPACTSGTRGRLWLVSGGGTAQDSFVQCQEGAGAAFNWASVGSGGGGSSLWSSLIGGTNSSAAMVVGSGASISATGGGVISATTVPWSGLTGSAPTFNQNTTGTSALANALAGTPTQCTGGQVPTGILSNGNAAGCFTPGGGGGGGSSFSAITNGTNTGTSMIVGNGSTLQFTGTGAIIASQTIGNASTAGALSGSPNQCTGGQVPTGILANGNATGCFTPSGSVAGTAGQYGLFSGSTAIGSGFFDYNITNVGMNTSTKPFMIQDATGNSGTFGSVEGTAPAGAVGIEKLYGLSGYFRVNMNNRGAQYLVPLTTIGTSGHCLMFDTDGIGVKDAGAACGSGGGGNTFTSVLFTGATSGTVTVQAQAVAGTPTVTWPTTSGQVALTTAEVVTFSATPTFTPGDSMSRIVLTGNITSFTLGVTASGTPHTLCFKQGASSAFTVTAPSNVHGLSSIGTSLAKWNCQTFMYDASDAIWLATSGMQVNQ